ncbi:Pentatricopeptide repeat [Dillenia turbinata]|uniref:Pentatricopeptide repeat n=1 Tax=Dillenia turbinata TaxID=194707 RepID=A0AAN8V593_9MAGN
MLLFIHDGKRLRKGYRLKGLGVFVVLVSFESLRILVFCLQVKNIWWSWKFIKKPRMTIDLELREFGYCFKACEVFDSMCERNDLSYGAMISSVLSASANVVMAYEVFNEMPRKDVATWSAIIFGLAFNGNNDLGLELFRMMEKVGPRPDAVTFVDILTAYDHKAFLNEAGGYLDK